MARLVRIIGSEFHQQYPATLGKEFQIWCSFPLESIDDCSFKTFQSDRVELQYFWNVIGREECILVSQPDKCSVLRAVDQFQLRFEHDRTSSFSSDERARNVESSFRQEFIQVVAGHSSRNLREARADQAAIVFPDREQLAIDLTTPSTLSDDFGHLRLVGGPHCHLGAVVKQNSQLLHVVDRFPAEQRMRSA